MKKKNNSQAQLDGIKVHAFTTGLLQVLRTTNKVNISGGGESSKAVQTAKLLDKNLKKVREFSNDYDLIDQIIKFYGQSFFMQEFDLKIDNIHNFVTSTYLNYPVEENFKMGNYTIVIEYFKKNFESFNN